MIIRYRDKLKELSERHGVPYADTVALFRRLSEAAGATPFQALQAIKCGYAKYTGIHEYFTVQDISGAFDISESEAERLMKESPDCLKVTFPDWMQMQ